MRTINDQFDVLNFYRNLNGKQPKFWTTESKAEVQGMVNAERTRAEEDGKVEKLTAKQAWKRIEASLYA